MTAPENSHDPMHRSIIGEESEGWKREPVKGITWENLATLWLRIIEGSKDHKAIGESREEIIKMAGILDDAWAEKKAQEEGAS